MTDGSDSLVYVVDDDPSVRDALESLLASVGQAAMTFATPAAFLAAERPDLPACLVLDVRLPELSGLDFQKRLAAAGVLAPIIFVSGHADVPMAVAAMKAGAVEFLEKPFRDQELLDAVQRAVRLDRARRAEAARLARWRALHELLTPREREIMALVAAGQANKQIAARLGLSEITVKVHRANVMRKMEAKSLPELVRIADRLQVDGDGPGDGIGADHPSV